VTTRQFTDQPSTFPDRAAAGRRLGRQLTGYRAARPVVVGVAPNGMPIAAEVAHALHAPLDTVAVAPLTIGEPPKRFGVAGEGGIALFDPDRRAQADVHPEAVDAALQDAEAYLQRRTELWHGGCPRPSLRGRTVLLVAEALVDEQSAAAAACAVCDRGAANVVYAVPRALLAAVMKPEEWIDEVVGLEMVDGYFSAADCYDDSAPVTVDVVQALLRDNRTATRRADGQPLRQ